MNKIALAFTLAAVPFFLTSAPTFAESDYLSDTLSFEEWCAERYDDERCALKDERDVREYERSLMNLEEIETKYNIEQRKEREFRDRYESQDDIEPANHLDTRSPPHR